MGKILNCYICQKKTTLRYDVRKSSPIKNLNCTVNEVKKMIVDVQNIDEVVFFKKYG
jgi:hypothetical protein